MKGVHKLYKFISVLNFLLLAVLGYWVLNLILKNSNREFTINSEPVSTHSNIDLSQSSSDAVNYELILERNIFNPTALDTFEMQLQQNTLSAQVQRPVIKKQLELRLLGTVAGDEEVACAIIEDMTTKIQDLYKTGDIIQGAHIEKIERNRIVLLNEGTQVILNLYVSSEDSVALAKETEASETEHVDVSDIIKVTSPTERQVNKSAFLAKIGGIEAILKTVEISPYTVDGKEEGLLITGLEGLSMARFIGLENGDIIRTINGQVITDGRKAFQVLQKARALSSLDMQLTRGTEQKILSFKFE